MIEIDKSLTEIAADYCQKQYDDALELLITQLFQHEQDLVASVHYGFNGVRNVSINGFSYYVIKKYFNLKTLDRGTFITRDYSFLDARLLDCFIVSEGLYAVDHNKYDDITRFYPLRISNIGEDDYGEITYNIETEPKVIYACYKREFLSFLDSGRVSNCKCISYKDYLISVFGDGECNKTFELIKTWNSKIGHLQRLPLSKLRKKNKNMFYRILYKKLFGDDNKLNLTDGDRQIVTNYLTTCPHSNEISRMIYTFTYTQSVFNFDKEYSDYLDLTFILVSIFKVVEVVFSNLLKERFGNKVIKDSKGNNIDFSNEKLTLGNMKQFFYSVDPDIQLFLSKNPDLNSDTLKILDTWIDKSRNDFLHKDIVEVSNVEQLNKSISDSLQLICNLIILFKKD